MADQGNAGSAEELTKLKGNIESLRVALQQRKDSGQHSIPIEALIAATEAVPSSPIGPGALESLIDEVKLSTEWQRQAGLETFRAQRNAGLTAIRNASLINGGAAVAILALIGNTWSSGGGQLATSLLPFAFGVLVATIASGLVYVAEGLNLKSSEKGSMANWAAIVFVVLSYLCFAGGVLSAFLTLR